jgi:hypothetical protein
MRKFFSQLNGRLMVIHFIAFWFFIYAFQTLSFLHDYSFLYLGENSFNGERLPARFSGDMEFIRQAGNIGLLVAYIISWSISTKREWFWLNSVIIFVLAFVLKNFGWLGWKYLSHVFTAPGNVFKEHSVVSYWINGFVMLAIGLLIFFSKKLIRYIDAHPSNPKKTTTGKIGRKTVKA